MISAKRLLAGSLAKLPSTLETQLDAYRRQIEAAFQAHPDHDVLGYLPGANPPLRFLPFPQTALH